MNSCSKLIKFNGLNRFQKIREKKKIIIDKVRPQAIIPTLFAVGIKSKIRIKRRGDNKK